MSVRVYNYAGTSGDILRAAESETERIFARAGVRLEWHECLITPQVESADSTCAAPLAPSDLQLRIVRRVEFVSAHASTEIAGFTVRNLATVQLDPLWELWKPVESFRYQMLCRAIAHEFGHVLLGPGHSSRGIMQGLWGEEQLGFAAANELVFTPDQEKALRSAVKARHKQ
jgi:hypothetical protein